MEPPPAPPQVQLQQRDIVLLVQGWLAENNLHGSLRALELESGCALPQESDDLAFIRDLVMDARWPELEELVAPFARRGGFDWRLVLFEIRRQRFLELYSGRIVSEVDAESLPTAATAGSVSVTTLVQTLRDLEPVAPSKSAFNSLCYCLTLPHVNDHPDWAQWTPYFGRHRCFEAIRAEFSKVIPSISAAAGAQLLLQPPPAQLAALLARATGSLAIERATYDARTHGALLDPSLRQFPFNPCDARGVTHEIAATAAATVAGVAVAPTVSASAVSAIASRWCRATPQVAGLPYPIPIPPCRLAAALEPTAAEGTIDLSGSFDAAGRAIRSAGGIEAVRRSMQAVQVQAHAQASVDALRTHADVMRGSLRSSLSATLLQMQLRAGMSPSLRRSAATFADTGALSHLPPPPASPAAAIYQHLLAASPSAPHFAAYPEAATRTRSGAILTPDRRRGLGGGSAGGDSLAAPPPPLFSATSPQQPLQQYPLQYPQLPQQFGGSGGGGGGAFDSKHDEVQLDDRLARSLAALAGRIGPPQPGHHGDASMEVGSGGGGGATDAFEAAGSTTLSRAEVSALRDLLRASVRLASPGGEGGGGRSGSSGGGGGVWGSRSVAGGGHAATAAASPAAAVPLRPQSSSQPLESPGFARGRSAGRPDGDRGGGDGGAPVAAALSFSGADEEDEGGHAEEPRSAALSSRPQRPRRSSASAGGIAWVVPMSGPPPSSRGGGGGAATAKRQAQAAAEDAAAAAAAKAEAAAHPRRSRAAAASSASPAEAARPHSSSSSVHLSAAAPRRSPPPRPHAAEEEAASVRHTGMITSPVMASPHSGPSPLSHSSQRSSPGGLMSASAMSASAFPLGTTAGAASSASRRAAPAVPAAAVGSTTPATLASARAASGRRGNSGGSDSPAAAAGAGGAGPRLHVPSTAAEQQALEAAVAAGLIPQFSGATQSTPGGNTGLPRPTAAKSATAPTPRPLTAVEGGAMAALPSTSSTAGGSSSSSRPPTAATAPGAPAAPAAAATPGPSLSRSSSSASSSGRGVPGCPAWLAGPLLAAGVPRSLLAEGYVPAEQVPSISLEPVGVHRDAGKQPMRCVAWEPVSALLGGVAAAAPATGDSGRGGGMRLPSWAWAPGSLAVGSNAKTLCVLRCPPAQAVDEWLACTAAAGGASDAGGNLGAAAGFGAGRDPSTGLARLPVQHTWRGRDAHAGSVYAAAWGCADASSRPSHSLLATCSNDTTVRVARWEYAYDGGDGEGADEGEEAADTGNGLVPTWPQESGPGSVTGRPSAAAAVSIATDAGTLRDLCWLGAAIDSSLATTAPHPPHPHRDGYYYDDARAALRSSSSSSLFQAEGGGGGVASPFASPLLATAGGGDFAVRLYDCTYAFRSLPAASSDRGVNGGSGAAAAAAAGSGRRMYVPAAPLARLAGHTDVVHSVRPWGPAARQLVSCSADGTLRIFDVRMAAAAVTLRLSGGGAHGAAALLPAGAALPSSCGGGGGGGVIELHSLAVRPGSSPLGVPREVAVGAADGSVAVVDVTAARVLACARLHTGEVRSIDACGPLLLSASFDGTVAVSAVTATGGLRLATPPAAAGASSGGGGWGLGLGPSLSVAAARGDHGDKALCARWHPRAPLMASSSADRTVLLWRVRVAAEAAEG